MRKYILSFLILGTLLQSCTYGQSEEDDLRAIPITNNPHIVPSHGSGLPMMGGG